MFKVLIVSLKHLYFAFPQMVPKTATETSTPPHILAVSKKQKQKQNLNQSLKAPLVNN